MIRLLILVALAVALWLLLERLARGLGPARTRRPATRSPSARGSAPEVTTHLVRCDSCGVHVPQDRALAQPGGGYRCEDCRRRSAAAG